MTELMCDSNEGDCVAHISAEVNERHDGRVEITVVATDSLALLTYTSRSS